MDEEHKQDGAPAANSAPQGGSQQNAQEDLKKVADRAKAATAGFDFMKLFAGRIDQMNYLYSVLIGLVAGAVLGMIPIIGFFVGLVLCVIGIGTTIRRFHDINITGWAALVFIIPPVAILAVIYLCWKHGDTGSNRFGDVPDPKRDVFKAILNT